MSESTQPPFSRDPSIQMQRNLTLRSPSDDQAFAESIARLTPTSIPFAPASPSPISPGLGAFSFSPPMPQPQAYRVPEDALAILREYDTVIIVDDSGSMSYDNRWQEACEALGQFVDLAAQYDTDGVDICFLNHSIRKNVKHVGQVQGLFQDVRPSDATYIGERLDKLTRHYLEKLEASEEKRRRKSSGFKKLFGGGHSSEKSKHSKHHVKPVHYIVITDGQPSDDPGEVIKKVAMKLDEKDYPASQLGIQFLQIGDDPGATAYLRELDDDLSSCGCRDIVDTTPYTGTRLTADMIAKVLLGGINRRVDKMGGASLK